MKTGMNMRTVKFGVAFVLVALLSWTPTAPPVGFTDTAAAQEGEATSEAASTPAAALQACQEGMALQPGEGCNASGSGTGVVVERESGCVVLSDPSFLAICHATQIDSSTVVSASRIDDGSWIIDELAGAPAPDSCGELKWLHDAARLGNAGWVACLADAGADVNAYDEQGDTPLHIAVADGTTEIARILVDAGADVNAQSYGKRAASIGVEELTQLFTAAGSEIDAPNAKRIAKAARGDTPLQIAVENGNQELAQILVAADMARNQPAATPEPTVAPTVAATAAEEAAAVRGGQALRSAILDGNVELVRILVAAGADVNARNSFGDTLIGTAIAEGNAEIVRILVDAGVDVNATNRFGDTPIGTAIAFEDWEIVRILADAGVNLDATNRFGDRSLISAIHDGNVELVRILVDAGVDVNATNSFGDTPIGAAIAQESWEIVRILADAGADLDATNRFGDRSLISAIHDGNVELVRILVDAGVDVNATNSFGDTPIGIAIAEGNAQIVRILVDAGVDLDATNRFGDSPLDTAIAKDDMEIVQILVGQDASTPASELQACEMGMELKPGEGCHANGSGTGVVIGQESACVVLFNPTLLVLCHAGRIDSSTVVSAHKVTGNSWIIDDLPAAAASCGELKWLHDAVRLGNAGWVACLADAGAHVNARDESGDTPLHIAVADGATEIARILIDAGADETAQSYGERAAPIGVEELAQLFTAAGSEIDAHGAEIIAKAARGDTPLHIAVKNGDRELVRLLVMADTAQGKPTATPEAAGTPAVASQAAASSSGFESKDLVSAIEEGDTERVRSLVDAGADIHATHSRRNTPLHIAVETGTSMEIARILVDAGADLNAKNRFRETPLHIAVKKRSSKLAQILADAGADLNAQDSSWNTPLHIAVEDGATEIVQILVDAGADLNARNHSIDRETPLHIAAREGKTEIARLLVEAGADLNAVDEEGASPLPIAIDNRNTEIARILIDAGADIHGTDEWGRTPLRIAVQNRSIQLMQTLIDAGADVHGTNKWGSTLLHSAAFYSDDSSVLQFLVDAGVDPNTPDHVGDTPLHIAAENWGATEVVRILVDAGANVNVRNEEGDSPLHIALRRGSVETEKVQTLVDAGADIHAKNKKGETPLQIAEKKTPKIVRILTGAPEPTPTPAAKTVAPALRDALEARDIIGNTSLHNAAQRGDIEMVRTLVDAGADLNARGHMDYTPLHYAVEKGHREIAQILVNAGADINLPDSVVEMTPLEMATEKGDVVLLQILLGADVGEVLFEPTATPTPRKKTPSVAGLNTFRTHMPPDTPLHTAIKNGDTELVRILVKQGADPNAPGFFLNPPLHCAVAREEPDPEMVRILVDAGADLNAKGFMLQTPLDIALGMGMETDAEIVRILTGADNAAPTPTATPTPTSSTGSASTVSPTSRESFETSTPAGYTRVTLGVRGSVWGVPARYTTDSSNGVMAYMLLGTLQGCSFADAEAGRSSSVYIRIERLGRLSGYTSQKVCQTTSSRWNNWDGARITHLRFFDESSPANVREYAYDATTGQYVETTATPAPTATRRRPAATPTRIRPTATPTPAHAFITITRNMNIRSGPSTDYAVVGYASVGETYGITGKNADGTWWRIWHEGDNAWIYAPYVTAANADRVPSVPTPEPSAPAPSPTVLPTTTPARSVDAQVESIGGYAFLKSEEYSVTKEGSAVRIRWNSVPEANHYNLYYCRDIQIPLTFCGFEQHPYPHFTLRVHYDVIARGLTDTTYLHEDISLSSVVETYHYYMIQVCFVRNCSELE